MLTKKLGYYVPANEIEYETLWLYKDELDSSVVDDSILQQIEETVIAHSVGYEATDGMLHEIGIINDVVDKDFLEGVNEV